ncbi:NAD-dependent epimerase/dehydratase [Morchella snyderi]|nr:NAD-dependent epimerase/dehydratase [Morchella snyderi]
MKVLVTGAAGFIGQKLVSALIADPLYTDITITDIILPKTPSLPGEKPVTAVLSNLAAQADREMLVTKDLDAIFILHGIMSGMAEKNFESGMMVNFDSTRGLLECARKVVPGLKVVFASSLAVFGGTLPDEVTERTMPTPSTSYGMQKMLCEYLINDYSRRGYIDGRILRFPTVVVRPGAPSGAASSFVSGIIREPLNNLPSVLPVSRDMSLWVSSPRTVVSNILHAVNVPTEQLGETRQINLPGITVTVEEMLEALGAMGGEERVQLVKEQKDETVERIVGSWPARFSIERAMKMGFVADGGFTQVVKEYIEDEGILV